MWGWTAEGKTPLKMTGWQSSRCGLNLRVVVMGLVNASTRSGSASIITRRASRVVAPDPLRHSTDKSNPAFQSSLSLPRGSPSLSVRDISHGRVLVHAEDLRRDQPPLQRKFLAAGTESRPSLAQYQLGQTSAFSSRLFYLSLALVRLPSTESGAAHVCYR